MQQLLKSEYGVESEPQAEERKLTLKQMAGAPRRRIQLGIDSFAGAIDTVWRMASGCR